MQGLGDLLSLWCQAQIETVAVSGTRVESKMPTCWMLTKYGQPNGSPCLACRRQVRVRDFHEH